MSKPRSLGLKHGCSSELLKANGYWAVPPSFHCLLSERKGLHLSGAMLLLVGVVVVLLGLSLKGTSTAVLLNF